MMAVCTVSPKSLEEAGKVIKQGGLVAFPTETVYGLGADATNGKAVAKIFEAKGRPAFNPLISHFASIADIEPHAVMTPLAKRLADHFWPGPMTLVLDRNPKSTIDPLVCAGLDTIAVRVPSHPDAKAFIQAAGTPVAAPSANISGKLSPTSADHVARMLGAKVDMILAGGKSTVGLESTVIDARGDAPIILRLGSITKEDIENGLDLDQVKQDLGKEGEKPSSPGQLLKHYAPSIPVRLNALDVKEGEALLAFGPVLGGKGDHVFNLSEQGDLSEAASNLFSMLHQCDQGGYVGIAVMPIPDQGIGRAINDRLQKAARG